MTRTLLATLHATQVTRWWPRALKRGRCRFTSWQPATQIATATIQPRQRSCSPIPDTRTFWSHAGVCVTYLPCLAPSPPGPGRHAPACLLGPSPNSLVHYPPPPCPQASEARACVSAGSKFHPGASGLALILQAVHGHRSLGELTVVRLDGGRPGLLGGLPAGLLGGQARATRGAACWATRGAAYWATRWAAW